MLLARQEKFIRGDQRGAVLFLVDLEPEIEEGQAHQLEGGSDCVRIDSQGMRNSIGQGVSILNMRAVRPLWLVHPAMRQASSLLDLASDVVAHFLAAHQLAEERTAEIQIDSDVLSQTPRRRLFLQQIDQVLEIGQANGDDVHWESVAGS